MVPERAGGEETEAVTGCSAGEVESEVAVEEAGVARRLLEC